METANVKKQSAFKKFFSKIKQFFVNIGQKINKKFSKLKPLVLMQLKDKIDFSFLKSKKKTLFKIIYSLLLFAGIIGIIYVLFLVVEKFGIFSFLQTINFRAYLVLMTVVLILSFIACLVNVTKTLYFAKDNPVLLTMPAKNGTIFASKLIVCYVYELIKNATYILPFFIAYGLIMKLSVWFFFWSILSLLLITTLIVTLSGLLSIPAMLVTILLKKHKVLRYFVVAVVLALITYAVYYAINLIPQDIDLVRDWGKIYWSIQSFLADFATTFMPFDYLLRLLVGMVYNSSVFMPITLNNLITFSVVIGIIIFSAIIIVVLSKKLFLKMASSPFEYRKNEKAKAKLNKKLPVVVSSTINNSKKQIRETNVIYSIILVALITPVAIYLQNKIIGAMDTRMLGNFMGIAFNILIVLLMMLSTNVALASAFSSEGNSAYLNKIVPIPYKISLTSKLVLNSLICILSIICSTVFISLFAHLSVISSILLGISLIFVYLSHLFWSAELDVMNPQNLQYQTTGKSQKNPNETKSTIIAFVSSFVFSFVTYFLMSENSNSVYIKILLISTILVCVRSYLYFTRVKLFYGEK